MTAIRRLTTSLRVQTCRQGSGLQWWRTRMAQYLPRIIQSALIFWVKIGQHGALCQMSHRLSLLFRHVGAP
eukprot:3723481-Pyramimonas_sp.AAC.1